MTGNRRSFLAALLLAPAMPALVKKLDDLRAWPPGSIPMNAGWAGSREARLTRLTEAYRRKWRHDYAEHLRYYEGDQWLAHR